MTVHRKILENARDDYIRAAENAQALTKWIFVAEISFRCALGNEQLVAAPKQMSRIALDQREIEELLIITIGIPHLLFDKALLPIGDRQRVGRQESHVLFYLRQSLLQERRHTRRRSRGRTVTIGKLHVQPKDIFGLRVLPVEAKLILYPQKDQDAAT